MKFQEMVYGFFRLPAILVILFISSSLTAQKKPVSVNPDNPFYFSDPEGKPLILTGDYTWETFSGPGSDYLKMFRSLKSRGLNLARVWLWWGCEEFPAPENKKHLEPFLRTGPGIAADGKSKYDLGSFNPEFFSRLSDLCRAADDNGIYLQLILMDTWMIKHENLWKLHAFNINNNINGVNGDPGKTGKGTDGKSGFCSMGNPRAVKFQKAYINKVVRTINEFNNVYFEIANENYYSEEWELMLCEYIKGIEKSLPKQHMTIRKDFPSHSYVIQKWDPLTVHNGILAKRSLRVPLLFDTDWIINDNDDQVRKAAWSAIATGAHFSYMDDAMEFYKDSVVPDKRAALHKQIDYMAGFIRKFRPWEMTPADSIVRTGLAFVLAGSKELFAYLPGGGDLSLDLSGYRGKLSYEWFNPVTGVAGKRFLIDGGAVNNFTAQDKNDWTLVIRTVNAPVNITLKEPSSPVPQYDVAEFTLNVENPFFDNPFTDADVTGIFTSGDIKIKVNGFADSGDGTVYRLRFSPEQPSANYDYVINFTAGNFQRSFAGKITSAGISDKGPVIADPANPKKLIYSGTKEPFFHLGYTAYNLLDSSNDDPQVEATIKYCKENGFNKIRFLLSGYPRDFDNRTSDDVDHGVPADPMKSLNYGALPGKMHPLPTWEGNAHNYDFTRFNVAFWQKVDKAVKLMRENGIIATCIFMIEKQNLPREIGSLSENEYRLYRFGVARLAAFDNVWWDLGNEHNEYRNAEWGNTIGDFVRKIDPYKRMASAHAYAEFFYSDSHWADFIITQQYGSPDSVHNWALKYYKVPKPYINEEYGYEGVKDKPVGHGMNSDWVRKCHWAITMAGGYGTYGDWSEGISYFYMGIPGPGKAVSQLNNLKKFFDSVPFNNLVPADELTEKGYCLSLRGKIYVIYLPEGGTSLIDLSDAAEKKMTGTWYDPVEGKYLERIILKRGKNLIKAPGEGKDYVLLVKHE